MKTSRGHLVWLVVGLPLPLPAPGSQDVAPTRPANHLSGETSPYLLQHAHNPVDWYPWGPEAFDRARREGKPVFLSIGYSSCYWCHVMERESFEDEKVAHALNEGFISIKVDREERPDVDQVYMTALQAFSGRGGWPLSMFLTPEGKPFFGGTYFPRETREGMPGFLPLLDAVRRAWAEQRESVERDAEELSSLVRRMSEGVPGLARVPLDRGLADRGRAELARQFDPEFGGFGFDPDNPRRPKFPEPVNLLFLLDQQRRGRGADEPRSALDMVERTLDHLSRGGIRDHLAGGYHRYSTDRAWAVPHFEKMLYDNALLAEVFVLAFEATGDSRWKDEARSIFGFVAATMTGPEGGFHSALDAESEAEEGKSYVWTRDEVKACLSDSDDYDLFARVHGLEGAPNFEGERYVLSLPKPMERVAEEAGLSREELGRRLEPMRARLLEARRLRPQPFRDDKVLTAWNGLMIGAYANGARAFGDPSLTDSARRAAEFVLVHSRDAEGRLLRTHREGRSRLAAYLEDYAYLIHGLLALHEATKEARWLDEAKALAERMVLDFTDEKGGGFFFTANDHESLLARMKDPFDGALPSPAGVAVLDLLELARLGDSDALERAGKALEASASTMNERPGSTPTFLIATERYLDLRPGREEVAGFRGTSRPTSDLAASAQHVKAAFSQLTKEREGSSTRIRAGVTLTIARGWHINANPASEPNLIPTSVSVPAGSSWRVVGAKYPMGQPFAIAGRERPISVYEGTQTIELELVSGESAEDVKELSLVVRFQACDERSCLAPSTIELVGEPGAPRP